jgi:hypothetical protein
MSEGAPVELRQLLSSNRAPYLNHPLKPATDIAAAFGLRLAHCLVVINELVWAGALSISVRNER